MFWLLSKRHVNNIIPSGTIRHPGIGSDEVLCQLQIADWIRLLHSVACFGGFLRHG
jgi:hypothetical protein